MRHGRERMCGWTRCALAPLRCMPPRLLPSSGVARACRGTQRRDLWPAMIHSNSAFHIVRAGSSTAKNSASFAESTVLLMQNKQRILVARSGCKDSAGLVSLALSLTRLGSCRVGSWRSVAIGAGAVSEWQLWVREWRVSAGSRQRHNVEEEPLVGAAGGDLCAAITTHN